MKPIRQSLYSLAGHFGQPNVIPPLSNPSGPVLNPEIQGFAVKDIENIGNGVGGEG